MMFKKGSFEVGGTVYPAAIKVHYCIIAATTAAAAAAAAASTVAAAAAAAAAAADDDDDDDDGDDDEMCCPQYFRLLNTHLSLSEAVARSNCLFLCIVCKFSY